MPAQRTVWGLIRKGTDMMVAVICMASGSHLSPSLSCHLFEMVLTQLIASHVNVSVKDGMSVYRKSAWLHMWAAYVWCLKSSATCSRLLKCHIQGLGWGSGFKIQNVSYPRHCCEACSLLETERRSMATTGNGWSWGRVPRGGDVRKASWTRWKWRRHPRPGKWGRQWGLGSQTQKQDHLAGSNSLSVWLTVDRSRSWNPTWRPLWR